MSPAYRRTQREARELYRALDAIPFPPGFVHPLWEDARAEFERLVVPGVPRDFLGRQIVRHLLYRTGFGELEEIELAYIESSSDRVRTLCHSYVESTVGEPLADCEALRISVAGLNKLYYFARIARELPEPGTVVDFGGGYGQMCHVLQTLLAPPPTYVSVDLPELLALQYTFLRASGLPVRAHTALPVQLEPRIANLVPVQLLPESSLSCDLFLSTFALSETPAALRAVVIQSEFFGASSLYLTGQETRAELWAEYSLQDLSDVRRAAHDLFGDVHVQPMPAVSAWELFARRAG